MTEKERLDYYAKAGEHKKEHMCGGVPYEYGDVLISLVTAIQPRRILEVGTGIGYSAACLAEGNIKALVDTIDKDAGHLQIAQETWNVLGKEHQITAYLGKAEDILPTLQDTYDFIFYDGYVPQKKLLLCFEKMLCVGGLLVTANLFLNDANGGWYLKNLKDTKKWQTGVFADTAIAVKRI